MEGDVDGAADDEGREGIKLWAVVEAELWSKADRSVKAGFVHC